MVQYRQLNPLINNLNRKGMLPNAGHVCCLPRTTCKTHVYCAKHTCAKCVLQDFFKKKHKKICAELK